MRNLPSARLAHDDVTTYIRQEVKFVSLLGPFQHKDLPFKYFGSPIGTVLKLNSKVRRLSLTVPSEGPPLTNGFWLTGTEETSGILLCPTPKPSSKWFAAMASGTHSPSCSCSRLISTADTVSCMFKFDDLIYLHLAYSFGNCGATLTAQSSTCDLLVVQVPRPSCPRTSQFRNLLPVPFSL